MLLEEFSYTLNNISFFFFLQQVGSKRLTAVNTFSIFISEPLPSKGVLMQYIGVRVQSLSHACGFLGSVFAFRSISQQL